MKLVIFNSDRLGCLIDDDTVIDLILGYNSLKESGENLPDIDFSDGLLGFINQGKEALTASKKVMESIKPGKTKDKNGNQMIYKLDEVKLSAPLPSLKSRILMAGSNFYDHARDAMNVRNEKQVTIDEVKEMVKNGKKTPWGFWKQARNVIGPEDSIIYPERTKRLDYECELAAIIGEKIKDVPESKALQYVYGYTIINDMSCRDQHNDVGIKLDKNFDSSVPMGPCLVTSDEVEDPYNLGIKQSVKGELRQNGNTRDMIWGFSWWISHLSRDMTLYPGDIIAGGTCSGTAMDQTPRLEGGKRVPNGHTDPKLFLKPGDEIIASIEKIGVLKNKVISKKG